MSATSDARNLRNANRQAIADPQSHRRREVLMGSIVATVGLGLSIGWQTVVAQEYPSRPITLIVPYPAGGANDAIGRLVGQKLADSLGQPVVVDNRPGAGTTIGTALAAKAAPDGYTLLLGSLASHAASPHLIPKIGYDPIADFAPIGLIGVAPTVATVAKDSPFTSTSVRLNVEQDELVSVG
jgi:tripartite-type tricarboxylate transporter receptor subunit TctC